MVNLLAQYISFQSIEGNASAKQECLDWIETSFLSQAHVKRQAGSLYECPYLLLSHPDPVWLWFAHIDVVPAGDDLFTLQRDGDYLKGRGVKDMKGSALPFLMAYRDAVLNGRQPAVSILLSSDEEIRGATIPKLLEEGMSAPVAFTPDTGSTNAIVVEHKGALWAELIVRGKGCHAALPWEGENPIVLLAQAVTKLTRVFPTGTNDDWQITVTPTRIFGGKAQNQVPDSVSCSIDVRYPPEQYPDPEDVTHLLQSSVPEGVFVSHQSTLTGLNTDPSHPFIHAYKKHATEVVGEGVHFRREHGGTDARHFGAAGIPAFLYGPVGGGLHASDEWVSLSSLIDHYKIYERLFQNEKELSSESSL